MKVLNRFIFRAYLGPLVLTFFIAMFVLQMQWLWKYIDDLIGKGLPSSIIFELLAYATTTLIPMALPLAILLASIMTFGNLGENYELLAIKSSGISLFKIMRPLIIFNIIVSISAFYFSNNILPWANLKMSALMYDVKNQSPELSIKEGAFFNDIEGYSIRVGQKNTETGLLRDIMVYDHSERRGNVYVTIADSGYMNMTTDKQYMILNLFQGSTYSDILAKDRKSDKKSFRRDTFEEETMRFQMDGGDLERTDEGLFKRHYQMMNIEQLANNKDSLQVKLAQRKALFGTNLLRSNYFKRLNNGEENELDSAITDSLNYEGMVALLNALDEDKQNQVLKIAANYARSTKSYIGTTHRDMVNSSRLINRHWIEWHRKFTLSFACLVFFFIGAPFGAIIRKGGLGMPLIVSVVLFILYYILSISGENLVKEGLIPAYQGMWVSAAVLLPLGIFLSYKAATDSVILSKEAYIKFFVKLGKRWIKSNP